VSQTALATDLVPNQAKAIAIYTIDATTAGPLRELKTSRTDSGVVITGWQIILTGMTAEVERACTISCE